MRKLIIATISTGTLAAVTAISALPASAGYGSNITQIGKNDNDVKNLTINDIDTVSAPTNITTSAANAAAKSAPQVLKQNANSKALNLDLSLGFGKKGHRGGYFLPGFSSAAAKSTNLGALKQTNNAAANSAATGNLNAPVNVTVPTSNMTNTTQSVSNTVVSGGRKK